jgi:hypothetical protein
MRKLGRDVRGNFRCDIGQPVQRFYLGNNEKEAYVRRAKLDQLWAAQKDQSGKWDELSLAVAKAVAAGKPADLAGLDSLGMFGHAQRLAELQKRFPMASFVVPEAVAEDAEGYGDQLQREGGFLRNGFRHGVQFHQALDRFKDHIRLTKKPGSHELTDSAVQICNYADLQKQHVADFPMSALTLPKVDEILAYGTNRPPSERGGPMARDTIRDIVKIFRRFLRWAHREGFWSKPQGYEVTPLWIRLLSEEFSKKARAEQVDCYKRGELVTLYEYATPWERLLLPPHLDRTTPPAHNGNMGRVALRTLLIVSCLVLAMPQGWCSYFPALCGKVKGESTKKAHGGCCDLCHCKDREKPPPEPEAPSQPSWCCCYELDWLKPNPPSSVEADLLLVGFVMPVIGNPACTRTLLEPGLTIHVPSPPIYLLNCAWLC